MNITDEALASTVMGFGAGLLFSLNIASIQMRGRMNWFLLFATATVFCVGLFQ